MKIILVGGGFTTEQDLEFANLLGLEHHIYRKQNDSDVYDKLSKDDVDYSRGFVCVVKENVEVENPTIKDLADTGFFEFDIDEYRTNAKLIEYVETHYHPRGSDDIWVKEVPDDEVFSIQMGEYGEYLIFLDEIDWVKVAVDGNLVAINPVV